MTIKPLSLSFISHSQTVKYHTQRNPRFRLLLIILLALSFIAADAVYSPAQAVNARKKLSEIRQKIKSKKEKIRESIKKERSVSDRIEDINRSIKEQSVELKSYDSKISRTKSKIRALTNEIDRLKSKLYKKQGHLKERLIALYKQQYGGNALVLISARDNQDLIRKSKYISLLAYYDNKVISRYSGEITEINAKKQKLEGLNSQLTRQKDHARTVQKHLRSDRVRKDKLLAMIRSKRNAYEKSVRKLEESSRKLQRMISRMKKKKLPRSITGKGFAASRGRLPWPVKGRIVTPYGKHKDPEYNITVFRNGIEIKPGRGEKPRAIAGGRVVYADWFKGYGLLLIIDHGSGYHSLYGNLSGIFLKTGDILIEGTVVGKIGKSNVLNYPALYFEIRHKGKPVNPVKWLKRKGKSGRRIRIK